MPDGQAPRAAPDRLTEALQRARLTQDPLGEALVFIHEAREDIKAAAADVKAVAQSREPVPPEAMERAARSIAQRAGQMLAQGRWWAVAGAVGSALCVGLGIGFGAGWMLRAAQPVDTAFGPMSASAARIVRINALALDSVLAAGTDVPQPQGGRARQIVLWTELPPAAEQQARR